ncbi:Protein CBG11890 [Caenorhabditis briggsae]|uniref:Protein CBG11890 n=1 Tax=Caenorhabditis briggsae TaxID=6238 RepID=A8XE87_CAEBR|nr:Protein CBG11890 [Caenorhabditis briggsae]CAP30959.1 Protein CBG11890 [Caenorhabditis briggsae]
MSKRGQSSSMSYKDKANLHFVEQEEPAFIKAIKAKMGYKEPAKLEDKFDDEAGPADFDDDETDLMRMKEEDRPQVVVLNEETDLTKEELSKELEAKKKEEGDKLIAEGKITFKKPVKQVGNDADEEAEKKKKKNEPAPKVQKGLLSFGDDEEDEE